jgi:hypothetical protein
MKRAATLALASILAASAAAYGKSPLPIGENEYKRLVARLAADPAQQEKLNRDVDAAKKEQGAPAKTQAATPAPTKKKTASKDDEDDGRIDYAKLCKEEAWIFTLRQDFKDARFLSCPTDPAKAHGAEFSYANDRAAGNTIWSVNGTAALTRVWHTNYAGWPTPYRQGLGPYFTMNRVRNSSAAANSDNVDKYAYGLAYEAFFNNIALVPQTFSLGGGLRLRAGGVQNNIKHTSASNFVAEFMPAIGFANGIGTYSEIPLLDGAYPLVMSVEPSLITQYNAVSGKGQSLDFNDETRAWQVGGDVNLVFSPSQFYLYTLKKEKKDSWFARWNANVGYRWTHEIYSNRALSWLNTGLTYNLDPNGYFALGFSYQRGADTDTGTFTNIYKISLTGKL